MDWDDIAARRISTRELRMFLAVARLGSMAKAAKALATSQPAISKAIADMEHNLGVRLLDRSPQGVEPTQYGRALIKCGVAVFSELKQGINEIGFLADPTAGELRIGCPDPVAAGLVRTVIDRLLQKHPRITFYIETESLARHLRERNIELAINRMPEPNADDDFDAEILYHDTIVVVARTNSPSAAAPQGSAGGLGGRTLGFCQTRWAVVVVRHKGLSSQRAEASSGGDDWARSMHASPS